MSNIPNISTPSWNLANPTALLFMVDLDWPLNNERVPRLHWLATGLTLSSTTPLPDSNNTTTLNFPTPPVVNYMQPAPPVGDIAHSYNFYLFGLPTGFQLPSPYANLGNGDMLDEDGKIVGGSERAPFNVNQFLLDCGLDEQNLLARNHVRVRNLAGHPTMSFPPPRQATGMAKELVPEESATSQSEAAIQSVASLGRRMVSWSMVLAGISTGLAAVVL